MLVIYYHDIYSRLGRWPWSRKRVVWARAEESSLRQRPHDTLPLSPDEGAALSERLARNALRAEDRAVLVQVVRWLVWLVFVVEEAKRSLTRLRTVLCGQGAHSARRVHRRRRPRASWRPRGKARAPCAPWMRGWAVRQRRSRGAWMPPRPLRPVRRRIPRRVGQLRSRSGRRHHDSWSWLHRVQQYLSLVIIPLSVTFGMPNSPVAWKTA